MEENLESLICALSIIRNHCKKHLECTNCVLLDVKNDCCRVIGEDGDFPSSWDMPKVKQRKEIIF